MCLSYRRMFKLMKKRGITGVILAEATGISRTTLARMSKGLGVSSDVILRICVALDCDVGDIVHVVPIK